MQLQDAQVGTGKSSVYGDARNVQAAPSQLPVGGLLFIQALAEDAQESDTMDGGGDINIVNGSDYQDLPANFQYGQSISIVNGQLVVPTRDAESLSARKPARLHHALGKHALEYRARRSRARDQRKSECRTGRGPDSCAGRRFRRCHCRTGHHRERKCVCTVGQHQSSNRSATSCTF